MNRRKLFKYLALAPFAVPAIAKAAAECKAQEEIYRRLQAMAKARYEEPVWFAPHGLNRGDLQNLRGRTVYYVHLDESNWRLERV